MSGQHTPGGWYAVRSERFPEWLIQAEGRTATVAVVYWYDRHDDGAESDANARLIVAAPDMLAALELARATLADHGQQDTDNWPTFQTVDAAIAKATEGTP
jgi:hypothetical protein